MLLAELLRQPVQANAMLTSLVDMVIPGSAHRHFRMLSAEQDSEELSSEPARRWQDAVDEMLAAARWQDVMEEEKSVKSI